MAANLRKAPKEKNMKKSIWKILGIIVLVKVLLIVGGIVAFLLYRYFSKEETVEDLES